MEKKDEPEEVKCPSFMDRTLKVSSAFEREQEAPPKSAKGIYLLIETPLGKAFEHYQ